MKSGVSLFQAFINDIKKLNPVFNKAEVETFIKKHPEQFLNENIIKTLISLVNNKQLFDYQEEPSLEQMASHKIVINILKYLITEQFYRVNELERAVVYYFYQIAVAHIKNRLKLLILLKPQDILEKGTYKKYIDETVECHKDVEPLTDLFISLMKEPHIVDAFSNKEFKVIFKENLLDRTLEFINASCMYANLLQILGETTEAKDLFAKAKEQLQVIEQHINSYCKIIGVRSDVVKKRVAAFKESSQFHQNEALEWKVESNELKVLQCLKKLNNGKPESAEIPFLEESVWATYLAEILLGIKAYREKKNAKMDLDWCFKHLPNIQLSVENPSMGLVCFANAKAICLELRSIYIKESKVAERAEEKIYFDLIIFYLETLVKGYIVATNNLLKLKDNMFAYDLIQEILDLPFDLEGDGAAYLALYEKYKGKYFGDDVTTAETLSKIINQSQKNIMLGNFSHFHVRHFLVKALPCQLIKHHSKLYSDLWHYFSCYMLTQFYRWRSNLVLLGNNTAFVENIKLNMNRYQHYKAIYQPKRLQQNMDAQERYDEELSFALIESSYAGLLCTIGDERGHSQQLAELNTHLSDDMRAASEQLAAVMKDRGQPQIDTYKMLENKLKEVNEIVHDPKRSGQGEFYQLLIILEAKLALIKAQLESKAEINTIGDTKILTTPLMLLEDILKENDITAGSMELLFTACDFVNEEAFRYEQKVFFTQLCVFLTYVRATINERMSSFINKLLIEKLTTLLGTSKEIFNLVPEFDKYPEYLVSTSKVFVADVANLPWTQLDAEVHRLLQTYELCLFANRKYLFLTLSQIPLQLYPATTFGTDIKVLHVLLKIIGILTPTMGSMDLLVNEIYISLFRTLCNYQITTCVNIHEKKIPKGAFLTQITNAESGMLLLEQYMPQFKVRHPCFQLKREHPEFEGHWINLKSLVDVYLMYAVICVMQMDFKKAKKNLKIAKEYITQLKDNVVSTKQIEYLQQLQRCSIELEGFWTTNEKDNQTASQFGKAYQLLKKCEVELPDIVKQLSSFMLDGLEVVSLKKPDPVTPIPGLVLLLNRVITLPKTKPSLVKQQLADCIDYLIEYQQILENFQSKVVERFCVVELIQEKLPRIIKSLQAALEKLPAYVEPMERLQALFTEATLTDMPVCHAISAERKKVKKPYNENAEVLRLVPVMTEDDEKIKELIHDALTISANLDDLTHYFLYQSYSAEFNHKEAAIVLMKAAIKRLNDNGQRQPLLTSQQKVNLTHFLLMYFSQHMSNNPKIKRACVDILWLNLTQQLRSILESCLNNCALIDVQSTLALLTSQRALYDYYSRSHDIISDPQRYKQIDPHLFTEIDLIDNTSLAFRKALITLYQDELMKTVVDVTQPVSEVPSCVNHNPHLVKNLRQIAELNEENVKKITQLFVELRSEQHRWQAYEFFKCFKQLLEKTISRVKKPISFADALIIKPIQDMLDCCISHSPQEPLLEVIHKVEKLQVKSAPTLKVPELVNQLIARFKQCPVVTECELIGGAIRDLLLGIIPHDYDFVVQCEPLEFMKAFKDAYQPAPHKRPELIRLRSLEQQGFTHDIVCASKECPYTPDLTINTYRWNGETLVDPNVALADIEKNYLVVNGDSKVRFQNDPTMMLRIIRLSISTRKSIQDTELMMLQTYAPLVTSLEMGLYLTNMSALFLRSLDQAYRNINFLLQQNLLNCLLPAPLCEDDLLQACCLYQNYLHYSIFELYMNHATPQGVVFNHDTKYELLALFLMPVLLNRNPNKQNKTDLIDQLVNDYCRLFKGFAKTDAGKHHTAYKLKACLSRKLARFMLPDAVHYAQRMALKRY